MAQAPVIVPWLGVEEEALLQWAGWGMIVAGVATFIASQTIRAPYGRYSNEAGSLYGPPVPARLAWIVQECPSVFVPLICLFFGTPPMMGRWLLIPMGALWGTELGAPFLAFLSLYLLN